jgi:hypothetical protein
MRKLTLPAILLLYFLLSGFDFEPYDSDYEPVFMFRSELEKSIRLEGARQIENPGKIYIKDQYVFIVEKYLGIHVIDNSNPEDPENFVFFHIDGCIDMAMKDNILYADNAVDLISVSVNSSLTGIEVKQRIRNVFPEVKAPDGRELTSRERMARPDNTVLVRWKQKQ